MLEEIRRLLGPNGRFAALCPGYEYREEQVRMAEGCADALARRQHLLVEAGTGVGKTVAYLIPSVLYSAEGRRVVVSTHTINLQSQLVEKDIPLIQSVLDDIPFTAVLMKGRGNFLCLTELDHASASVVYQADPLFERLRSWASETETGDISELDFVFPDWSEVCSNPDTCKRQECAFYQDRCFYYRMRREAETAQIVVVNHSLFFTDLGLRMQDPRTAILPDYRAVVFDEAHHLEDVACNTFGIEFSNYRIPWLLNRIRKRRDIAVSRGELDLIERVSNSLFDAFRHVAKQEFFFEELYQTVDRGAVEETVNELINLLDGLNQQLLDQDTEGNEELKDRIAGYRRILGRMRDELGTLFFDEHPNYFRWCEQTPQTRGANCFLHLSPVSAAELLEQPLWESIDTVICTSATLSNSGTFCYFSNRLGVPEHNELILGSPFDYASQALLYVPDDLDFPSERAEYADALSDRIDEILRATHGRALLLFTSYRMMNAVFERLVERTPFRLIRQGEMSNERLISEFRNDPTTCLLGVHSFWEGVDVKGERLSCVIIDKLPFAVPDSPTHRARCEAIEREGGDWFRDYAVPQAQMRLKQGFGRLIRTKSDFGVVAILDSRIHKKFYGKDFLRYLPRCRATKHIAKIRDFLGTHEPIDVEEYGVP